jgi:ribosomal protein S18 acetylase RimI-like enzyme
MSLQYLRAKTTEELEQILKLQQSNLPARISSAEKAKEGFVTVRHTLELLGQMNRACPHVVVKDGEKVVGYALCMHPDFCNEVEVLRPMFEEISSVFPIEENYMVMGQICIDKPYRGKGVFRELYATMKEAIQPHFSCIITEVDVANVRSLKAHYAIGFKELKRYSSGGQDWHLIILR